MQYNVRNYVIFLSYVYNNVRERKITIFRGKSNDSNILLHYYKHTYNMDHH